LAKILFCTYKTYFTLVAPIIEIRSRSLTNINKNLNQPLIRFRHGISLRIQYFYTSKSKKNMKKLTFILSTLFIGVLANAQGPATTTPVATVAAAPDVDKILEFKEANHDFGKIAFGKPVEFDVTIKNISNEPIKIEKVDVQCGCTTPKYDATKAYASGETFKVTLGFNGGTEGPFEKTATIFFNNGTSKQIKFFGVGYKVPETPAPANGPVQKMKTGGSK
jgi:hypothetical protein